MYYYTRILEYKIYYFENKKRAIVFFEVIKIFIKNNFQHKVNRFLLLWIFDP
jgi:hypothetical protein